MPFKHFIQKIEGRLPHYTTPEPTNKPKFPYKFDFSPWHRVREFISGDPSLEFNNTTALHEAFLWRVTPQGHDYWSRWSEYTFEELPDEPLDIVCAWEEQYDLTLEEEVYEVQEGESQWGSVRSSTISPGGVIWVDESTDFSNEEIDAIVRDLYDRAR